MILDDFFCAVKAFYSAPIINILIFNKNAEVYAV